MQVFVCRRDTEPLPKERLNTSIDTSTKNNNIKLTPQPNKSGGVRRMFNDRCFLIQLESPKKYQLESLLPMSVFHFGYNHSTKSIRLF